MIYTENNVAVSNENDTVWSVSKVTRRANAKNSSSKPVVKHALRQQAKRRRKNTTIAAGNVAPIPRIILPSNQINSNYIFNITYYYNYKSLFNINYIVYQ